MRERAEWWKPYNLVSRGGMLPTFHDAATRLSLGGGGAMSLVSGVLGHGLGSGGPFLSSVPPVVEVEIVVGRKLDEDVSTRGHPGRRLGDGPTGARRRRAGKICCPSPVSPSSILSLGSLKQLLSFSSRRSHRLPTLTERRQYFPVSRFSPFRFCCTLASITPLRNAAATIKDGNARRTCHQIQIQARP